MRSTAKSSNIHGMIALIATALVGAALLVNVFAATLVHDSIGQTAATSAQLSNITLTLEHVLETVRSIFTP